VTGPDRGDARERVDALLADLGIVLSGAPARPRTDLVRAVKAVEAARELADRASRFKLYVTDRGWVTCDMDDCPTNALLAYPGVRLTLPELVEALLGHFRDHHPAAAAEVGL
jgi:hypothetical protein